jgi:sterol desaturase/sphingolipid hydroxylase (fatty acid hydroxylase superfamily)
MRKIKLLAWLLCLIFVCGLILLPAARGHLEHFISQHRGVPMYVLLALLLAIPAKIVTLVTAFLFELLLVGWSRSSLKTLWEARASVKLDALSIAMSLLPLGRLGYILSLGLLFAIDTHSVRTENISLTHFLPLWGVQVTILILFHSFFAYWMHRLEHAIPALWALHKFHHSADRMSIFTSERRTVLTKGVEEALLFIPLILLSDPTAPKPVMGSLAFVMVGIYAAFRIFTGFNMYLCHSNLTTDYGWIGRWLLVSPRMHRLHHAASRDYHDKNFTFDLVIWDRLFGTYATCDASAIADIPLGLDDNPFNTRASVVGVLRNYFLTPYWVFWQELRKGFKAWLPARLNREQNSAELRPEF